VPFLYPYQCENPACAAEHEERRPAAERDLPAVCRSCRASARRIFTTAKVLIPRVFGTHIHTTGLKQELGGGPWQDLVRSRQRWDW
jgi:hypothetical protein